MNTDPDEIVSRVHDFDIADWRRRYGPLTPRQIDICFHRYLRHDAVANEIDDVERSVRATCQWPFMELVGAMDAELKSRFPGYPDYVRRYWACIRKHGDVAAEILVAKANAQSAAFEASIPDSASLMTLYQCFMRSLTLTLPWAGLRLEPDPEDDAFNAFQARVVPTFLKVNGDIFEDHMRHVGFMRKKRGFRPAGLIETLQRLFDTGKALRDGQKPKRQPAAILASPPNESEAKEHVLPTMESAKIDKWPAPTPIADDRDDESLAALATLALLQILSEREREVALMTSKFHDLETLWGREHRRRLSEAGVSISHTGLKKMGKRIMEKARKGA